MKSSIYVLHGSSIFQHVRNRRSVTAIPERLWPNGTIPYVIGENITGKSLWKNQKRKKCFKILSNSAPHILSMLNDWKPTCAPKKRKLYNKYNWHQFDQTLTFRLCMFKRIFYSLHFHHFSFMLVLWCNFYGFSTWMCYWILDWLLVNS